MGGRRYRAGTDLAGYTHLERLDFWIVFAYNTNCNLIRGKIKILGAKDADKATSGVFRQ